MTTPFWSNDPTILFNSNDFQQLWPTPSMIFEEKLNAITRMILVLSILGFVFTRNINYLMFGIITLALLFLIYRIRKQQIINEGFTTNQQIQVIPNSHKKNKNNNINKEIVNPVTLETVLQSEYYPTSKKNPMGNVLLTDIMDSPDRKAAAPSFNVDVSEDIRRTAKKTVQHLNPGIKNTNKQLFGDLYDNFEFDWCMWNFYPTANTRVTNDQGAYGQYLYGNMPSAKDGNAFALVQDNLRYILI